MCSMCFFLLLSLWWRLTCPPVESLNHKPFRARACSKQQQILSTKQKVLAQTRPSTNVDKGFTIPFLPFKLKALRMPSCLPTFKWSRNQRNTQPVVDYLVGDRPSPCFLYAGTFLLLGLHQRVEKEGEVKPRQVQLPIYYPTWFKITAKMRFYVIWGFQRTPPPGSQVTSDHTGPGRVRKPEGRHSGDYQACPPPSSYTKGTLVPAWLGFTSSHTAGLSDACGMVSPAGTWCQRRDSSWTHWDKIGKEARWLGQLYPSAWSCQTHSKGPIPIFTQIFRRKDIFRPWVVYFLRSRPLWCYL